MTDSDKLTKKEKLEIAYEKLTEYTRDGKLIFNIQDQPTLEDFQNLIQGETMTHVANCVLNTQENFPLKINKDGKLSKKQREYLTDDCDYNGKKIDYLMCHEYWKDGDNDWLYTLFYGGHLVKIGMTINSLEERFASSYSCGTERAMKKGSCSTTNFIISECNYVALKNGMPIEIYGIKCPPTKIEKTRFGITKMCNSSTVRDEETMLTECFKNKYNHLPALCVQSGK